MANGNFGGGNGIPSSPYIVEDAQDLNAVRNKLDAHYRQVANINLSGYSNWTPIGISGNFLIGSYNGGGFSVTNLSINRPSEDNIGLFGYNRLELSNITVSGSVKGKNYVGLLCGNSFNHISNCHSSGNVSGTSYIGGLTGYCAENITNSDSSCTVIATGGDIGGLAGGTNGFVLGSHATGNVTGSYSVGGLIGNATRLNVSISYATGNVTGITSTGGLIGTSSTTSIDSYATGNVTGTGSVGGILGSGDSGSQIKNSYASGNLSGDNRVGGLVGSSTYCVVIGSFYMGSSIIRRSGSANFFGDMKGSGDVSTGTGYSLDTLIMPFGTINSRGRITIAQAKQSSTYSNLTWDMESVWFINENNNYPTLISRGNQDNVWNTPYTHYMNYIHVIPHIRGTANYMGVLWFYMNRIYTYPQNVRPIGLEGQSFTYSVGNLEQRFYDPYQQKEVDAVFLFSGVMDKKGPGGYAFYTDEQTRTVFVQKDRAAVAQFYFVEPKYLASTNYKLSVSSDSGVLDVLVNKESSDSAIRFVSDSGEIWSIPTVLTSDEEALPIRVATGAQIEAFKKYTEFSGITMRDDPNPRPSSLTPGGGS
jgi:hypothetical protein